MYGGVLQVCGEVNARKKGGGKMKRFIILCVFLIAVLSSFASAETITTILNISTASDYVTIATEDGTASYACNVTSTNSRVVNLQRNITTPELLAAQKSLS